MVLPPGPDEPEDRQGGDARVYRRPRGLQNGQIAERLVVSVRTVETPRRSHPPQAGGQDPRRRPGGHRHLGITVATSCARSGPSRVAESSVPGFAVEGTGDSEITATDKMTMGTMLLGSVPTPPRNPGCLTKTQSARQRHRPGQGRQAESGHNW